MEGKLCLELACVFYCLKKIINALESPAPRRVRSIGGSDFSVVFCRWQVRQRLKEYLLNRRGMSVDGPCLSSPALTTAASSSSQIHQQLKQRLRRAARSFDSSSPPPATGDQLSVASPGQRPPSPNTESLPRKRAAFHRAIALSFDAASAMTSSVGMNEMWREPKPPAHQANAGELERRPCKRNVVFSFCQFIPIGLFSTSSCSSVSCFSYSSMYPPFPPLLLLSTPIILALTFTEKVFESVENRS